MSLKDVITYLEYLTTKDATRLLPAELTASKIGLEACKRLQEAREWSPQFGQPLLPGETLF